MGDDVTVDMPLPGTVLEKADNDEVRDSAPSPLPSEVQAAPGQGVLPPLKIVTRPTLRAACLDLGDDEESAGGMDFESGLGGGLRSGLVSPKTPRTPWGKKTRKQREDAKIKSFAKAQADTEQQLILSEGAGSKLNLSERAERESQLVDTLPAREFFMDEEGKINFASAEMDLPAIRNARHLEWQSDISESVERWRAWRQIRGELALARSSCFEAGISSHAGNGLGGRGSEPPPSPDRERTRKLKTAQRNDSKETGNLEHADVRYRNMCGDLKLPASPIACHALRTLDGGAEALPKDFAIRAYLGNRGAEVLFMALASAPAQPQEGEDPDSIGLMPTAAELPELKRLDLAGQGLGNEAAAALAHLLPKCTRLESLDLNKNHISERGANILLQEVASHPTISHVSLDMNPVPSYMRVRLKELLTEKEEEKRMATLHGRYR
mmetsp:Transcript_71086/g.159649  ORF Transcript_71086/g.159649 Transcript_71086/m.159649 type:complete len:439 (+) Transcript_71086:74-1390(+)